MFLDVAQRTPGPGGAKHRSLGSCLVAGASCRLIGPVMVILLVCIWMYPHGWHVGRPPLNTLLGQATYIVLLPHFATGLNSRAADAPTWPRCCSTPLWIQPLVSAAISAHGTGHSFVSIMASTPPFHSSSNAKTHGEQSHPFPCSTQRHVIACTARSACLDVLKLICVGAFPIPWWICRLISCVEDWDSCITRTSAAVLTESAAYPRRRSYLKPALLSICASGAFTSHFASHHHTLSLVYTCPCLLHRLPPVSC